MMFKKIFNLFKMLRKLSVSGAIDILDEIKPIPKTLKYISFIFSVGYSKKAGKLNKSSGEKPPAPSFFNPSSPYLSYIFFFSLSLKT